MPKEINLGCGPRIKSWRKNQNPPLKGFELARLIKISQGSLSDIENSKSNPSAPTLVKFLKFTNINMSWLLTGKSGEIDKGEMPEEKPIIIHIEPGSEFIIRGKEKS